MQSRLIATFLLAALLGVSSASARPDPSAPIQLIDLTGDFTREWDKTAALPDDKRAEAFRTDFAKVLPGFYAPEHVRGMTPAEYDALLLKNLKAFPKLRPGTEDVSRRFSVMFQPALASFEKSFGPMRGYPPVYLVVSFGEFDGGTRPLRDGYHLMFGADAIAYIHRDHDIQPFFHHELFHLYHGRYFSCDVVWCGLWKEGLATYAASRLNPSATDAELMLNLPEPIRPAVEAHRSEAYCAAVERLDSKDPADRAAFFSGKRLSANLPPRFGYYIGYTIAAELGRSRSLEQLAHMSQREVRPLLEKTLRDMAGDCEAAKA